MTAPKVYAAMSTVQAELAASGISKDHTNAYDRYKYRGIDDVYNALGPALAKAGLLIVPHTLTRDVQERATAKGGITYAVTLAVELKFISAEDGSTHSTVCYGEAMDRGDKATPKAMAAAYKYGVFQAFCVPTDATPDADSESHTAAAAPVSVIAPPQVQAITAALKVAPEGTEAALCKKYGAIAKIPADQFDRVMAIIKKRSES